MSHIETPIQKSHDLHSLYEKKQESTYHKQTLIRISYLLTAVTRSRYKDSQTFYKEVSYFTVKYLMKIPNQKIIFRCFDVYTIRKK